MDSKEIYRDKMKRNGAEFCLAAVFVLILYFWFQIVCRKPSGDTVLFLQWLEQMSPVELLKDRMEHVTARVVLEAILFFFLQKDWFWFALCNTGCVILTIGYLASYGTRMGQAAFGETGKSRHYLLAAFLFLLYPLEDLAIAGIVPSFINYVWSGCLGLAAIYPLVRLTEGKASRLLWLLAFAAAVPAGNMEQVSAVLLVVIPVLAVVAFRQQMRGTSLAGQKAAVVVLWFIFLGSALFLLQGGNAERMKVASLAYWPDFQLLSFWEKVWNGIITTTNHLLSIPNMIFLFFSFLLFLLAVVMREKKLWIRFMGVVPLFWECLILTAKIAGKLWKKDILRWFNGIDDPFTEAVVCPAGAWIPLVFQMVILFAALVFLWNVCETYFWRAAIIGLLGIGFGSRVLLGFSPTLFASHARTFYCFYMTIYLVDIFLFVKLEERSKAAAAMFLGTVALAGPVNFIRMVYKIVADLLGG